jgi:hypothetical protein
MSHTLRKTSQPTSRKQTWRRWLWDKRLGLILFFPNFAIGFLLGFACRRYLVFKNEVGIGDVLNAASAIIIALLLQNFAQKQFSNTRVEKDLLISCVNDVIGTLKEAHKLFLQKAGDFGSVDEGAMQATYKHFANALYTLEKAIEACQPRTKGISLNPLKGQRGGYRKIVLGGGFPALPYSVNAIAQEEQSYRTMIIDLQKLVFEINRK